MTPTERRKVAAQLRDVAVCVSRHVGDHSRRRLVEGEPVGLGYHVSHNGGSDMTAPLTPEQIAEGERLLSALDGAIRDAPTEPLIVRGAHIHPKATAFKDWCTTNRHALIATARELIEAQCERASIMGAYAIESDRDLIECVERHMTAWERRVRDLQAELARVTAERDAANGILRTVIGTANTLKHVIPTRSRMGLCAGNDWTIAELIEEHFDRFDRAKGE